MFQSSRERLRAWLSWTEDILGDRPEDARRDDDNFHTHPHRRALRWERTRRPGTVAPRPAHCISPVRPWTEAQRRERAAR